MTDTVRIDILDALVARFKAIEPPNPLPPTPGPFDWPFKFSNVELGPLAEFDFKKRYSLGVVPISEREAHNYPYVVCFLRIGIEFRVTVNRGDPAPVRMGEVALGVVKRAILSDRQINGLVIDTNLVGNEIDVSTYADKSVVGVQFVEVQYRHNHLDPRNPSPND